MKKLILSLTILLITATFTPVHSQDEYFQRGNEYRARGDSLRAEGQYLLAVERDPQLAEAHVCLGEIYMLRKKFPQAIEYFEKALSLGYRDPQLFIRLSFSYHHTGDVDRAISVYQMFAEAYPNIPEAHLGLGALYEQKGMKAEAEEAYGIYRAIKQAN